MKIFTSYYANLKNIPPDTLLVSISKGNPYWCPNLISFNKLGPTREILEEYKAYHDEVLYKKRFISEVLNGLDVDKVMKELMNMVAQSGKANIVLLCYEGPDKFCHRHIVAEWLTLNGYITTELKNRKGLL